MSFVLVVATSLAVVLLLVVGTVALLLTCLVVRMYLQHLHWLGEGLPSAPFIPVVGHIFTTIRYLREDRMPDMFRDRTALYDNLFSITYGPISRLTVNSPPHIADVLRVKAECYNKGFISRLFIGNLVGFGSLLLTERDEHSKHRHMINPAFHHNHLEEMVELMVEETDKHVADWLCRIPSHGDETAYASVRVDLHREMSAVALAVISKCAFGTAAPSDTTIIYDAFNDILKWTEWRFLRCIEFIPVLKSLPILHLRDITSAQAQIHALAERVILERRAGRTGQATGGRRDLLDLLLSATDSSTGDGLTETEVRDEAMTFVLAGHETTANLLSWMLYVCTTRAHVWEACKAEVDAVFKDSNVAYSQLNQLPVLNAVMNETLRLFPPVPILHRDVSTPHVMGANTSRPVHMLAGTRLQIEPLVVHLLPEYWGDRASEFDHTRWLQPNKPYTHPFAFLPFSSGPRNCIGMNFAQLEAKVVMVRVLQRTRMEWTAGQKMASDGWPVRVPVVALRPKYGLLVNICKRSDRR